MATIVWHRRLAGALSLDGGKRTVTPGQFPPRTFPTCPARLGLELGVGLVGLVNVDLYSASS